MFTATILRTGYADDRVSVLVVFADKTRGYGEERTLYFAGDMVDVTQQVILDRVTEVGQSLLKSLDKADEMAKGFGLVGKVLEIG